MCPESRPRPIRQAIVARVAGILMMCLAAAAGASAQTAAGGAGHTLILKSDGTVWTVGLNSAGQLGDNSTTLRLTPVQVSGLSGVVAVAAGNSHSMAITSTGALYVWGNNGNGQVGDASTTNRTTPVQSNLSNVVAIAAGKFHSVALLSNGDVYTWGKNASGQLGNGTTTQSTSAVQVATGAAAIGAGFDHTLFVKTDGTVYGTGLNTNGQLGDTSTTSRSSPVQMTSVTGATKAVGGETHSVILLSGGTLKVAGLNIYGMGDGTATQRTTAVVVSTLTNITAIAGGMSHTLARESDGTVWVWGRNTDGQIGDGTNSNRSAPVEITSLSSIAAIGAGHAHSVAVTSSGVVYTWGDNSNAQLGDGTSVDRWTPVAISDAGYDWKVSTPRFGTPGGTYGVNQLVSITITTAGATIRYTQNGSEPTESDATVSSGSSVSVTTSQTLKAKAFKSGMAASTTTSATYELKVATPAFSPGQGTFTSAPNVTITSASSGATLRYTTDGSTPTESSTAYSSPVTIGTTSTLKALGFKSGWTTSDLRSGAYTMSFGTLSTPTANQATGTYVNSVTVTLSALSGATIRYTTNGTTPQSNSTIYTAPFAFDVTTTLRAKAYHPDYTASAELSRTYTLETAAPTLDLAPGTYVAGQEVTVTAPGVGSTMRYTINGVEPTITDPVIGSGSTLVVGQYTLKVKAWKTGANPSAVTTAAYAITGEVAPPALSAGKAYALAIRSDGVAWGWGANGNGQLGDGTQTTPRLLPQIVPGLTGTLTLSTGSVHSHVLMGDGSIVAFGSNTNGRLGDGTTTARLWPTVIAGLSGLVAISGGENHTVALHGNGTLRAWGFNAYGQLGDASTTARTSPITISGFTSGAAVAAGEHFSLALKQDGTVWAWGRNNESQLGDNSSTDRSSPVQASGLTTASAIAAGQFHSLALLADGTVRGWGRNVEGQVGDGTNTARDEPTEVSLVSDMIAIAAGDTFSLTLKDDGTVWAWGSNGSGQLGDGTTTARNSAAQVPGLSDVVQIAAGGGFALALESDGTVWAWGENGTGEVGDGTTTDRLSPVAIAGAGMNWRVATPILSLASGQFFTTQSVTVTIADPSATLRYTTTGVDPTGSDATVTSGGSIAINVSQTLKVSGWKTGAPTSVVVDRTYELKAVTPVMSPSTGAYGSSQSVTISSTTSGATLRYTTDGTEPTTSSTSYSVALTVADTLTLKARAYKTGWTTSDSGHASFWISGGTVATPTVTPTGGTQTTPPMVAMSTITSGATLRYTLDGATPTATSAVFNYPFLVPVTTTVKVKAFKAGYTASATTTVTYDVDASGATATPAIVPAGGRYAVAQTVTITGVSGATLRYTTDGSDPTTSSTSITSGNSLSMAKSQVLKVRAWASGLTASAVRRADFLITGAVSAGNLHSAALAADGTVWTWGGNAFGQLGDGTGTTRLTPVQALTGAVSMAAGDRHTLAAKADGTVWSWGSGLLGRLGNGSGTSSNVLTPTQITFTNAVAVAAGYAHSLVLKSDGTVWAFGENASGEIGDGTTTQRTTAVQVVGLSGVVAIAAGRGVSYALETDGAGGGIVWAWGANADGQLGDESTFARSTPIKVLGLGPVTGVASSAGAQGALALGADGKVYGWGQNTNGQLGIGSTTNQTSAQALPVLSGVRLVTTGTAYGLAIDATARAWSWGFNGHHLGAGDPAAALVLVPQRSDLAGALAISGGDLHNLAAMPDGTVHAFGTNAGRLGNNATTESATPVAVSGLTLADNAWLATDPDLDDLVTWREYLLGTDPLHPDSNGNGILDGHDDATGANATNPDIDGDGVSNWTEHLNGTDPYRADTDGDSVNDGADVYPLDPTRSLPPSSNPSDTTPPVVTLKEPVSARLVP